MINVTGIPTYEARYSLDGDSTWDITIDTDDGELHTSAARLCDVERRTYEAIRNHNGLDSVAFDVTFRHIIDLSGQPSNAAS